jgi:hypothetical protein
VTALAFWILAAVFAVRLFFVLRWSTSTAFLGATGVGVLGLFSTGVVMPAEVIDSVLGGINVLHLLRNLCVTGAVWLVREGIFSAYSLDDSYRTRFTHRPAFPAIVTAAIAIPFSLQDFVPTTSKFVPENVAQLPVFIYATVYMGILAFLALSVLRICLKPQDSRPVRVSARVVACGMGLLVFACLAEIIYMALIFFNAGSEGLATMLYSLFSPFFYSGVLLTSLGLGIPPVVKAWRRLQLPERVVLVFLTLALSRSYWQLDFPGWVRKIGKNLAAKDPSARLYEFVIRSSDRSVCGRPTPWISGRVLTGVQARFDEGFGSLHSELRAKAVR